jgi:hypothetical protein
MGGGKVDKMVEQTTFGSFRIGRQIGGYLASLDPCGDSGRNFLKFDRWYAD